MAVGDFDKFGEHDFNIEGYFYKGDDMSMRGINGRTVNVKRVELLAILKTNKELFITEYNQAMVDFKAKMIKELEVALKKAKKGELDKVQLILSPPTDYTDSYQEVIDMMEVSVDEVINLDSEAFKAYYKNEWSWSNSFKTLVGSYKI